MVRVGHGVALAALQQGPVDRVADEATESAAPTPKSRLEERENGEGVAEQEMEGHGQDDRPPGAQADGSADHQSEDLADGRPGEAVQGGAERNTGDDYWNGLNCTLIVDGDGYALTETWGRCEVPPCGLTAGPAHRSHPGPVGE